MVGDSIPRDMKGAEALGMRHVLVGDPSFKYLWILSREKVMDEATYKMLLDKAISEGFDVKPIIKVEQDCK